MKQITSAFDTGPKPLAISVSQLENWSTKSRTRTPKTVSLITLWISLVFLGQEVQNRKRGKSQCGCRGRVPNPGQAWGLAGRKRTCWLPDEIGTSMKTTKVLFGILTITAALAMQAQAQSFLTNDLVAYYPFNGNANDAVGTNNGTVHGAPLATNRFGLASSAYFFDGTEAYIEMAEPLPDMQSASFSAWISFPTVGTDRKDVFFEGDPNYADDFRLSLQGNDADFLTKDNALVSSGPMLN